MTRRSFRLHISENISLIATGKKRKEWTFISIRFVCRFGWVSRITPNPILKMCVFTTRSKNTHTCNKLPARITGKIKKRKNVYFKRNKANINDFPFSWALRQCNNNIYAVWLISNLLISICFDRIFNNEFIIVKVVNIELEHSIVLAYANRIEWMVAAVRNMYFQIGPEYLVKKRNWKSFYWNGKKNEAHDCRKGYKW